MTTWLAQEFVRSQKLEGNKAPMAQDPLEQVAIVGKHPHQVSLESWQLFNVFFFNLFRMYNHMVKFQMLHLYTLERVLTDFWW